MTDYLRPASAREAAEQVAAHPDYIILAGGTDLLVAANHKPKPPGVIDVFGLEPLVGVHHDEGDLVIGAATSYREIIASELAQKELPSLVAASREVGALQIQARGTIGGNIGTSSPVGDTLPVLLALDARIQLLSAQGGEREIPYREFCTGYRQTARKQDELIKAIRFLAQPEGSVQRWRKMGTRRAQSISKVMVSLWADLDGQTIADIRIGLGAVAATPVRANAAEAAARGQSVSDATADAVRAALVGEIHPIDDVRSTASYRLNAAGNVVRRMIAELAG
ncbi:MAG: FAD binding domain-containing protein [Deltaproteobacteria bacterium]|nr:FAD binding domain-containing protein [Deltaproteobacteria bacterium]